MPTYYDKKKLINDSKDVYLSDYDKNLDYSYLSDIIDQKRAYKTAENSGDYIGMQKANDRANSIRLQAGSYTAGTDGSKYNMVKRPYESAKPKKLKSSYLSGRDRAFKQIEAYDDFKYDINTDPLYKSYRDIYVSLGNDAYDRAFAENAIRTGGADNTSAVAAAQSARNKYNSMLASKVPELYDIAYDKYKDGLKNLYDRLNAASDIEKEEYRRYRDDTSDYFNERNYYYAKDKDISDELYTKYKDETALEYDIARDEIEDKRKNDEFAAERIYQNQKLQSDKEYNKYKLAADLAKAMYGKVPVSASAIKAILSIIE